MDVSTLAYIAIGLAILILADRLGYIKLKRRSYLGEHESRIDIKLIHPKYGTLTIIGGREINGQTLPITKEFGFDTVLPIPMELYKTVFPVNPVKFMMGDPDGMILRYVEPGTEDISVLEAQIMNLKKREAELVSRNNFLESENMKLQTEYYSKIRSDAEVLGDVKKKMTSFVPQNGKGPIIGGDYHG